ncbi:MAG: hypothetical protein HW386_1166 [Gammaproteobacteria bacterium]|nr:hypothetical protein [Gammaproteobacteria bacterium]
MAIVYFEDFRSIVLTHYREVAAENPEYQSTAWFLLRYLKRIEKTTTMPTTPEHVENSMRGFIRFYVDRIDAKSPLGERCIRIYEEYRKTLRDKQSGPT